MSDIYYSFLCACLRSDLSEARALVQNAQWNWGHLFEAANNESILPALSTAIPKLDLDPFIPQEVSDFISAVESLNRERNFAIRDETKAAVRLLNEAGIEPVLLKGSAYLATGVYRDPASRYLWDVDLLIPKTQLETAVAVLIQNGFERDETDQFGRFRHHHPPLRRRNVSLELHHTLGLGKCGSLLPAGEVIESSLPYDLHGVRVRVPCPEHLMTHLIAHSQVVHPYNERIWPPVRALYDLVLLQRRFGETLNWQCIEDRFRKTRLHGLLTLHLLDLRDALGTELPLTVRLTPFTRLRQLRRKCLRAFPALRYLDPIYMFSALCNRRLRILRNVLSTPDGWKHLAVQLCKTGVYERFFTDMAEGRGR